jgi:6-phosphogluconolactonase (cycloisomerase 2 family)
MRRSLALVSFVSLLATIGIVGTRTQADQGNPWNVPPGSRAPELPPQAQPNAKESFYASTGAILTHYALDEAAATLTPLGSVTLPRNVQYAWPSPNHRVLYVAWSAGTNDRPLGEQGISSFHVDKHTGALTTFGTPVLLLKRPVHIATDNAGRYLLAAHNHPPSGLTVWAINPDGSLGTEVPQPGVVDGGIYGHQILVDPFDRMAILTTRGNVPAEAPSGMEEPGAMKVFAYNDGVLSDETSVAPNEGFGFQPRHVAFSKKLVYLAVERQNQLQVYERHGEYALEPLPTFTKTTLADPVNHNEKIFPAQMVGPIQISHDGRFVYVGNRNNGQAGTPPVFLGGENNVAVFAIDKSSGEPTLIQNADTRGFVPRTISFNKTGKVLVAANQSARSIRNDDGTITAVPTSLAVFRINSDGRLSYVRKYDNAGGTWAGFLAAP